MSHALTYLYCLLAAPRRPKRRRTRSLPGAGPVRLLEADNRAPSRRTQWLAVADAPVAQYGEAAVNRRLSDLEWVSRVAVAHEAVVESFTDASALLPMKLFTLFTSDERALEHVRREARQLDRLLEKVEHHEEWGVRLLLDPGRNGERAGRATRGRRSPLSGVAYLLRKKAQHDSAADLLRGASHTVTDVYDLLAQHASAARRHAARELRTRGGPLLLDAAFLVPRARVARFQAAARREARALERKGYHQLLTGPWPPYSFMEN